MSIITFKTNTLWRKNDNRNAQEYAYLSSYLIHRILADLTGVGPIRHVNLMNAIAVERKAIFINNQDGCRWCVTPFVARGGVRLFNCVPEVLWSAPLDNTLGNGK